MGETDDATFEIVCNRCRASVPSDVEICPGCGAVLIARAEPAEPAATSPARFHEAPATVSRDPRSLAPTCQACGRTPATRLAIRRHVGMVVLQRFVKLRGHFCRDCGTKLIRAYTLQTLWQGWWGVISVFANALTILANLAYLVKIRRLPAPEQSTPYAQAARALPGDRRF